MAATIPVRENIITWALARAGYDLTKFSLKYPALKVERWLQGEKQPTVKQLEDFSKKVHIPFGYLFLQEPPNEEIDFPFFRSGQARPNYTVSPNVYDTILELERRQDWLRDYLIELGSDPLDFIGKFKNTTSVSVFVNDLRDKLNLPENWYLSCKTWEDSLTMLINAIEKIGIIVVQNGIVGNNTHRPIPVDECRGFVLVDEYVPFMFINNADAKAAQLFTLIHELAHIWLGKSAGFNQDQLLPANDDIELICDRVAAEFLVPKNQLLSKWNNIQDIRMLAARFKVSPIVIARRALDLNLITKPQFFSFYNNYMEWAKKKKDSQGPGGDFYRTTKRRVSPTFASYVDNAVKNGRLTYQDAFKLTGLFGDVYTRFINQNLMGS
ncbi:ImmA/IrrE family metallo-endopeptidase [Sphingobacterium thalpophilum]|uniref:ImmA/IrrE family metallo-endopeptidase n=1 Tax=Sphingobacterium thalpophilum TaxID=259 RepID=UPI0024A6E1BF|nr:ImmA/IrrE family metallo-endopeptidase [Sphingobacterium thalpophilum]